MQSRIKIPLRIKAFQAVWPPRGPLLAKVEDVQKTILLYRKTDGMMDEQPANHIKSVFGYGFSGTHKHSPHFG